jgi:hypothetical protein
LQCATDAVEHGVEIVKDLMVGETQDRPSGKLSQGIWLTVVATLGSSLVVGPIDFDDQRCLDAAQVDGHRTQNLLPAELGAQLPIAQRFAQCPLSCGG